jgi:hypothetical protein
MSTSFVIARQASFNRGDVYKHLVKNGLGTSDIAHFQTADDMIKSYDLLRTTTDPNHKFLLYKDYHLAYKIDDILREVYNYKIRNDLSILPFLEALRKNGGWVPKEPFPIPHGVFMPPEYSHIFAENSV